jgi:hypothetical protein
VDEIQAYGGGSGSDNGGGGCFTWLLIALGAIVLFIFLMPSPRQKAATSGGAAVAVGVANTATSSTHSEDTVTNIFNFFSNNTVKILSPDVKMLSDNPTTAGNSSDIMSSSGVRLCWDAANNNYNDAACK